MPPVFAHGALRLYLLATLEGGPAHGYEIIRALADRFGGTYSPSAGTVYPRLAKLQEEGLLTTTMDGRRTVYSLTAAGQAELERRRHELTEVQENISASVRRLADDIRTELADNMRSLRADLAATAETAKNQARTAPPQERAESAATAAAVKDLEFALAQFRDELRISVRRHAMTHGLDAKTLSVIKSALEQAAATISSALK